MKHFASYGSLRKGFYNHDRFGLGEPIATSTIRGSMFVNPLLGYPMLYEHGDEDKMRDHIVEIYQVDDNPLSVTPSTYQIINDMELGAGYIPKEVTFQTDSGPIEATVWFMDPTLPPLLSHWVEKYS